MADTFTVLLFVGIVGALVVGIAGVVWHNGQALGLSQTARRWRTGITVLILMAWLGFTGILAANGFFDDFMTRLPPPFALALFPPWITVICCVAIPALRNYLVATPMVWLIGYQTFRVVVEYVLWLLYQQGLMPHAMTLEGQNIDLVVGVTAPIAAFLVVRERSWTPLVGLVWNVAALLILLNTIRVAFQSVPGVFYDASMQPANTIVSQVPFIWLPAFVVPVALLGHAVALAKVIPMVMGRGGESSSPAVSQ